MQTSWGRLCLLSYSPISISNTPEWDFDNILNLGTVHILVHHISKCGIHTVFTSIMTSTTNSSGSQSFKTYSQVNQFLHIDVER
jgi:hypothetical protein